MKMNEEAIFDEALEKKTPEERAAFLEKRAPLMPGCARTLSRC